MQKIKAFGLRFKRYMRLTNTPSVVGQQIPVKPMELQAEFAEQDASTTTSPAQQFTIGIRIKQRIVRISESKIFLFGEAVNVRETPEVVGQQSPTRPLQDGFAEQAESEDMATAIA
jgi:hypothetical protein